jgi:hypothetical protein
MVWSLSEGFHKFTFYGRERNTKLDQIKLELVSVNPIDDADTAPVITSGPEAVKENDESEGLSTDPQTPTVINDFNKIVWEFDYDKLLCSQPCTTFWQYRASGSVNWIDQDAYVYSTKAWCDNPALMLASGNYDFRVTVTDCIGQTTSSEIYYIHIAENDMPPVIINEPFIITDGSGLVEKLSTDPENPTPFFNSDIVFWLFYDDRASCSGPCTLNLQVRTEGTNEWFTQEANSFMILAWYNNALYLGTLSGLFDLRVSVTDCAGQTTYSNIYYIML